MQLRGARIGSTPVGAFGLRPSTSPLPRSLDPTVPLLGTHPADTASILCKMTRLEGYFLQFCLRWQEIANAPRVHQEKTHTTEGSCPHRNSERLQNKMRMCVLRCPYERSPRQMTNILPHSRGQCIYLCNLFGKILSPSRGGKGEWKTEAGETCYSNPLLPPESYLNRIQVFAT